MYDAKRDLTWDDLNTLSSHISYDPETGVFVWIKPTGRKAKVGNRVGATKASNGSTTLCVAGVQYQAHRVAMLFITGSPLSKESVVCHVNGDVGDNRIENLRVVTPSVNSQNRRKPRSGSVSGFMGVTATRTPGVWTAIICLEGKNHYLGRFTTPEAAHQAYLEAKRRLHPRCTI